jgi:polyisoprenyl-phosphate glycosyltransferase
MNVTILMPVFDEWDALEHVLKHIDSLHLPDVTSLHILVVNDGSTEPVPDYSSIRLRFIATVEVLDLVCNLGHQRAIALGLGALAVGDTDDIVLVMDGDGQDDPGDIPQLLAAHYASPHGLVVAERTKRSERSSFRFGYWSYRMVFRLFVGRRIRFGNFCVLSASAVQRLARSPDTWNHLAATLLRSQLPITIVSTHRGRRIQGRSKMNIPALLSHGLSAISVFSDRAFARLLLMSGVLATLAAIGCLTILIIRLATDYAIPGWATTTVGLLAILIVQALVICLIASVQLLAARSQAAAVPAELVRIFSRERRVVLSRTE